MHILKLGVIPVNGSYRAEWVLAFFRAARHGLKAQLTWVDGATHAASELISDHLLPLARQGLKQCGVEGADIGLYLGTIEPNQVCVKKISLASSIRRNSLPLVYGNLKVPRLRLSANPEVWTLTLPEV